MAAVISLLLLVPRPAFARGDVQAESIRIVRDPSGKFHVEVGYEVAWGADQGEFGYTLLVTQKRAGKVISVPLDVTETVHPVDACDEVCSGTHGAGACHYMVGSGPTVFEGSCRWAPNLRPGPRGDKAQDGCTCSRSDSKPSSTIQLASGDVVTFSITPSPSLRGDETSNNSLSVTIQ
ncbi:MAG: hypothetical protein D6718_03885 [Acidobacteria bacterium]|nr:MAG: hypothetical protein D6718_03885 [Acidobacteriota bacterium]